MLKYMKQVYLLTNNPDKIAAANVTFKRYDIEALPLNLDIPEIQAATSQEVARYTAQQAFAQSHKPVIREDHSFFIDELHIPGPFMTYMDKMVTTEQLLKILDTLSSRNGHFELAAAYVDGKGTLHEFSYQVPVEFAHESRGDTSQRWERIIKFKDDERVFAEYDETERSAIWSRNYQRIAALVASTA